jgi:thiol:disulfide interchange protein DsbD
MKQIITFLILSVGLGFTSNTLKAQEDSPVDWQFEVSSEPNAKGMYEITFIAAIEEKWHMYSQHLPSPDEGPLPTVFTFEHLEAFDTVGNVAELTKPHAVFDDVFEVDVNYFDGEVVFKQLVRLNEGEKGAVINGSVSYMVCNETTCLPPTDVPFSLEIKP